jgi:hypothetical protein
MIAKPAGIGSNGPNLFEQYCELRTQGMSQRQAAHQLEVPRTTLQAWQVYRERLDEEPAVVAFFQNPPGLAFLHRLRVGLHLVLQSRRRPCLSSPWAF